MSTYKILCFDGGGIKGALTAKLLQMLSIEHPEILEGVSLFAGTSTGGIISLGLATGLGIDKILDLYVNSGSQIFDPYYEEGIKKIENGISKPKYNNVKLKELLEQNFIGNPQLGTLNSKVLVNTFKLDNVGNTWYPIQLTNFPSSDYRDVNVVDAALRTSAAPTYFPSYQGYIDGGVFANNPSTMALSVALDVNYGNASIDDIRLLSFGTGFSPSSIKGDINWGALQWLDPIGKPSVPLISILMDGVPEVDDYNCRQILGDARYCRVNVMLEKPYPMDNWKDVKELIEAAESFPSKNPKEWEQITNWITNNFSA